MVSNPPAITTKREETPWPRSHPPPPATRVRNTVPKMIELTETVLFGDVWERKELSKRDRSLITIAVLTATYRPEQLKGHLQRALDNGVTKSEISEMITPRGVLRRLARRDDRSQHRPRDLRGQSMKAGFIGLGTMGASMAANLQKGIQPNGHTVLVYDIRGEPAAAIHLRNGAVWADSPAAIARPATSSSPRCPARWSSTLLPTTTTACSPASAPARRIST